MNLSFKELENRLASGRLEDETLEFKSDLFEHKKGHKNDILKGVVALANAEGGKLVIGISESENGECTIRGIDKDSEYVRKWISSLVYDYVEPDGLNFTVYPIKSTQKNAECIVIDVKKQKGKYFAIRHFSRKSQKNTSYYLPLRIGESNRFLEFDRFLVNIIANTALGFPELSTTTDSMLVFPNIFEFDFKKFKMLTNELGKVMKLGDFETVDLIRTELSDILPNLPDNQLEIWDDDLKNAAILLVQTLREYFETVDESLRKKIIKMLFHVAYRADKTTVKTIKDGFQEILQNIYAEEITGKKTSEQIRLLQILHNFDPKFIMSLIEDALSKWDKNGFDSLYNAIDFNKYLEKDEKRLGELRFFILKSLANARKSGNAQKVDRLKKFWALICSK